MILTITVEGRRYRVDHSRPIDLSIPLDFHGAQPNTYGVPPASSRAVEAGTFVGDTRRGGSCNFETHTLIPHCNGTHTECVGHISRERISVQSTLKDAFIPATLITVDPVQATFSPESYLLVKHEDDRIITAESLRIALAPHDSAFRNALVVRTLPNDGSKHSRQYANQPAPFFSIEAMHYIRSLGVAHLLVDVPSLDRALDEGKLSAHRVFWDIPEATHDIDPAQHSHQTVTEMIYADNSIPDGCYLLCLQIASFVADASPSRPLLFQISPET